MLVLDGFMDFVFRPKCPTRPLTVQPVRPGASVPWASCGRHTAGVTVLSYWCATLGAPPRYTSGLTHRKLMPSVKEEKLKGGGDVEQFSHEGEMT